MNKLTFIIKSTKGKNTNVVHDYEDFYIDGKSFEEYLPEKERSNLVTPLGWGDKEEDLHTVTILTKTKASGLNNDRVLLYGCPVDKNPMCGAITAEVIETEEEIIWRNYQFENQYSEGSSAGLETIPELHFDKTEYLDVFNELLIKF